MMPYPLLRSKAEKFLFSLSLLCLFLPIIMIISILFFSEGQVGSSGCGWLWHGLRRRRRRWRQRPFVAAAAASKKRLNRIVITAAADDEAAAAAAFFVLWSDGGGAN